MQRQIQMYLDGPHSQRKALEGTSLRVCRGPQNRSPCCGLSRYNDRYQHSPHNARQQPQAHQAAESLPWEPGVIIRPIQQGPGTLGAREAGLRGRAGGRGGPAGPVARPRDAGRPWACASAPTAPAKSERGQAWGSTRRDTGRSLVCGRPQPLFTPCPDRLPFPCPSPAPQVPAHPAPGHCLWAPRVTLRPFSPSPPSPSVLASAGPT